MQKIVRITLISIVLCGIALAVSYVGMGVHRPEFALGQALFSPKDGVSPEEIAEIAGADNASVHRVTRVLDI